MKNNQFIQFGFKEEINTAIEKLNFSKPTEIQQKVIPEALKRTGIIGQSHTGSGKTHAFLLPLFNRVDASKDEVQLVITAPTRELATQLFDEVRKIIEFAGKEDEWRTKLLIGGTDRNKMKEKLQTPPHIIVGTPGRILDMVKEQAISIYTASAFVIDEADLMVDLGFMNEVDQLLVRSKEDIQLLVFSATIPQRLEHFLKKYLQNPLHVKIDNGPSPELMEHYLIPLKHRKEKDVIMEITQVIQPYLAIIFTNSKEQADQLSQALIGEGLDVGLLHGGLTPRVRKRVLKDIQNLRYQYIVATDLASRGIDIKGVSHVINAQLPKEEEFYIHRVGRTARAGMEGLAISLYVDEDIKLLEKLTEKGLNFEFKNVRNGEWQTSHPWNKRRIRKDTGEDLDREAWKRVPKAKKVKPGYKVKQKKQQEAIKRQLVRKTKKANFKKR